MSEIAEKMLGVLLSIDSKLTKITAAVLDGQFVSGGSTEMMEEMQSQEEHLALEILEHEHFPTPTNIESVRRILDTVGAGQSTEAKLSLWRHCLQWWSGRGYRKNNITGLLSVFEEGGPRDSSYKSDKKEIIAPRNKQVSMTKEEAEKMNRMYSLPKSKEL